MDDVEGESPEAFVRWRVFPELLGILNEREREKGGRKGWSERGRAGGWKRGNEGTVRERHKGKKGEQAEPESAFTSRRSNLVGSE